MDTYPGVPISIYDISSLVKITLPLATTPKNITSGFIKTRIWPFNRNVFIDEDYLCSTVTDKLLNSSYNVDSINDTVAIKLSINSQLQSTSN